jgi:diguanylate cyclase (GGDEF)-like protein
MVEFTDELLDAFKLRLKQSEDELAVARIRIKDLEAMVETDPLLNILNRRGFERVLTRRLAYVSRYHASVALVFIDLDRFKLINDQYGHLAGDHTLKAVTAVINRHVRGSDIVGRFGGDEFTVLLWNLSESAARAKALALEDMIARLEIQHGSEVLSIGASAGVAILGSSDSLDDLIGRADMDMYVRKQQRAGHSRECIPTAFHPVSACA